MKLFRRLINYLLYQLQKKLKPEIIGGYKNANGEFLANVRISNTTHISYKQNLILSNHVFIGHFNYIDCQLKTTIGEGTQITNYVSVLNHSSHNAIRLLGNSYNSKFESLKLNTGTVKIGKYVFIGAHSVIMPNTEIGDGCIITAFSYVKGSFPSYSIIKGNPAVVVGDTREIDKNFLEENPELKKYYYLNNL